MDIWFVFYASTMISVVVQIGQDEKRIVRELWISEGKKWDHIDIPNTCACNTQCIESSTYSIE